MERFSGRRAWITGADTPLGAALARALYGEGAALTLSGVLRPPEGVEARCYPVNPVNDEHAARALEGFGPLDYLVHAAGHVRRVAIADCPVEIWEEEMEANLMTGWCAFRAAAGAIGPERGGAMLIMGSIHDEKPTGCAFTYSVAQGALSMMMREAAQDYGRLGIRVNMLEAGPLPEDAERFHSDISGIYDTLETKIPRGRAASLGELTEPALFLLSDAAAYINGATLRVDGGFIGYYGDGDSKRRWENGYA